MRYIIIVLAVLCTHSTPAFGQSGLTLEYGQNFTNLHFLDDGANRNSELNPNFSSAFNLGYRYTLKEGVYFLSKIGLRQGGASYVFDDVNYTWNLHYAEFRLGVGYAYDLGPLSVHFAAQGYSALLYKAEQQLHHLQRDMLAEETVENLDHGLFLSPGISYPVNEKMSLYLDGNYMLGLYNIEKDEGQSTKNSLIGASIGLKINL